jgi:hypothetical protein
MSHYEHILTAHRNSQTETYFVECPNLQYTQVYRVSHFNPTGIALTAFLKIDYKHEFGTGHKSTSC